MRAGDDSSEVGTVEAAIDFTLGNSRGCTRCTDVADSAISKVVYWTDA